MEFIIFLIIAVFAVAIIIGVVTGIKKGNQMKKKTEDLGALAALDAVHIEGLGIGAVPCEIFRFDNRILIDANTHKFEIQFDRLRAAVVKSEQELIEKGKSVVGRALIGTLLIPGLGTIVGGMSGIGNKKKKGEKHHYLIFNYLDSKGELAAVTFQSSLKFVLDQFCNDVNRSNKQSGQQVIQL